MNFTTNPQIELANDFVQYTSQNIFLTGKAGTGKTTFLHNLRKICFKRMIVVAPTGVAALNAGGVTIHSFFQLPFGPIIPRGVVSDNSLSPGQENQFNRSFRFSKDKINIIKSLDLLVIDEISMVRADLLDGIDSVLKRYKNRHMPFGGVQLLMIGDLSQLAPVVKQDEKIILDKYYTTSFFFGSHALQEAGFTSIELKHIYRQKDEKFINILNGIRDNKLSQESLMELGKRYNRTFSYEADDGYITLTTHNNLANKINQSKLTSIRENPQSFSATVQGDFPEYTYPTEKELVLKKGAQVMFVKNDSSPEKLYYNGKIGVVTNFDDEFIYVKCKEDESPIEVFRETWDNIKYSIDNDTNNIEESVIGSFTQYPLKLAWAITIHKSQGLTFDKAIVDVQAAFAHGQVYVALSRCRSLDGLVLSTPVPETFIKNDEITGFNKSVKENQPGINELETAKKTYQEKLVKELFDFNPLLWQILYILKLNNQHHSLLVSNLSELVPTLKDGFQSEITDVSVKFENQLNTLLQNGMDVEINDQLQERLKKASHYFSEKIKHLAKGVFDDVYYESDNASVRKTIKKAFDKLQEDFVIKLRCLESCQKGFFVQDYLKARAEATISKQKPKGKQKRKEEPVNSTIEHPVLFQMLKTWRNNKATEANLPHYIILHQKALVLLVQKMPLTVNQMKEIKGIGKKKTENFGDEIIKIISTYCTENGIDVDALKSRKTEHVIGNQPKDDTKSITLNLFKTGKSLQEIAKERSLTVGTIEGHLTHFIGKGEINVDDLITVEKQEIIVEALEKNNDGSLKTVKEMLGDDYSYGEIRMVIKYREFINSP